MPAMLLWHACPPCKGCSHGPVRQLRPPERPAARTFLPRYHEQVPTTSGTENSMSLIRRSPVSCAPCMRRPPCMRRCNRIVVNIGPGAAASRRPHACGGQNDAWVQGSHRRILPLPWHETGCIKRVLLACVSENDAPLCCRARVPPSEGLMQCEGAALNDSKTYAMHKGDRSVACCKPILVLECKPRSHECMLFSGKKLAAGLFKARQQVGSCRRQVVCFYRMPIPCLLLH